MTAMEKTAKYVADAIASGNYAKSEHEQVLRKIMGSDMSAEDKVTESIRIGNVSALRQQLEQAGLLAGRALTAFQQAVKTELTKTAKGLKA